MGGDDEATTRRDDFGTGDPTKPFTLPKNPIERYRVAEAIGRGGMGEVLDAHDLVIGRDVAIKRLKRERSSGYSIERFVREAKIQARLDHPSIVPVYEVGFDNDERPYFAMKKLAGTTLAKLLKTAPLQRLLRAFTDVCNAVEYAHERGIIHRDLKPENIMLGDYGETYVLDWGVAKIAGEDDLRLTDEHGGTLTRAGAVIGTPGYMAPEQARGRGDIDRRADVYALGCILFEILTGRAMHPSGDRGIESARAGETHRASSNAIERYIPPELDELCAHATAPDRELRVPTARELGDGVQRYLDGDRDQTARVALAKEHLATATAAFARGDHEAALRDAAHAIALDPHLAPAAELVTRCILEPPKHVPPEVESALDVDSDHIVRRAAKRIALTNLAYLTLLPFFWTQMHWGYTVALLAIIAVKMVVTWYVQDWTRSRMRYVRLVFNMFNIALLVRLTSPILLVPAAAAITAMGLMSGTFKTVRDGILVGGGLTLGAMLPWIGELTGVLSPTFSYSAGALIIDAPLVATELGMWTFVGAQTAGVVLLSILTTNGIRIAERAARRQVRLQAWRLSQLVPTGASP